MCIGKSDSLCDLIVFHGRIFQKFLCLLHSGADQNLCKSFSRHFFEYGAEITGADIKIRTDIIQTQVRIHIIFLNIIQCHSCLALTAGCIQFCQGIINL